MQVTTIGFDLAKNEFTVATTHEGRDSRQVTSWPGRRWPTASNR